MNYTVSTCSTNIMLDQPQNYNECVDVQNSRSPLYSNRYKASLVPRKGLGTRLI